MRQRAKAQHTYPLLCVVEVGRDGDDRFRDRVAEERFRGLLHLLEHHRRDLLAREAPLLALVLHGDHRAPAVTGDDLERPTQHVNTLRV